MTDEQENKAIRELYDVVAQALDASGLHPITTVNFLASFTGTVIQQVRDQAGDVIADKTLAFATKKLGKL